MKMLKIIIAGGASAGSYGVPYPAGVCPVGGYPVAGASVSPCLAPADPTSGPKMPPPLVFGVDKAAGVSAGHYEVAYHASGYPAPVATHRYPGYPAGYSVPVAGAAAGNPSSEITSPSPETLARHYEQAMVEFENDPEVIELRKDVERLRQLQFMSEGPEDYD